MQILICEVSKIDKRKFLTELSKLLTLMYEEDSRTAIAMYEQMFCECADENALISFFGSPTKQAVMLARCYNSKEKSLGVTSEHGASDAAVASGRVPAFVQAINDLREEAVSAGLIYAVQPVYFEDSADDAPSLPVEEITASPEAAPTPAEDDFDMTGLAAASKKQAASPFEEAPDFTAALADPFGSYTLDLGPAEPAGNDFPVSFEEAEEEEEEETSTYTVDEDQLTMEGFDSFTKPEDTSAANADGALRRLSADDAGEAPSGAVKKPDPSKATAAKGTAKPTGSAASEPSKPVTINIAIVILYLLVAVPITAVGVLLLLVPALLFLALSVATGIAAFNVISAAFGSFAVFADILVVLGAGLLLSAFALLFLLLFGWFIGCATAGLINGAIRLGSRICCREGSNS